ncbi:MAG TPA: thiamine pyrophosphate-dependent enzyme [bacterium]|nr:thiamine pyrophosphate-dependent enzyme [bacterium]
MEKVFGRPESLSEKPFTYCPGCGHSIIHRLTAEVIDELGIREKTIGVASVGCSVFADEFFNFDFAQAAHGRAPAVATGIKRVRPDCVVFTHQGDGDLLAIGTAETIHSANRGEKITVVFVNNAIYGMTGGQMAPTTLVGMKSTTCPDGRNPKLAGWPIRVCELLCNLQGVAYLERVAVNSPQNVTKTKRALKKAFEIQMAGLGFTLVEIMSQCPTGWGMRPADAVKWLDKDLRGYFPMGVFRDVTAQDASKKA